MTDYSFILILFIVVYLITVVLFSIKSFSMKRMIEIEKQKDEKINNETLKILLGENTVNKIDEIIDTFIRNAGDMYNILVLSSNVNNYMNENDIEKMQEYIILSVENNITDSILELIKLTHKIDNQQDLYDLINLRTKLYMINFVVGYNRLIDDDGESKK